MYRRSTGLHWTGMSCWRCLPRCIRWNSKPGQNLQHLLGSRSTAKTKITCKPAEENFPFVQKPHSVTSLPSKISQRRLRKGRQQTNTKVRTTPTNPWGLELASFYFLICYFSPLSNQFPRSLYKEQTVWAHVWTYRRQNQPSNQCQQTVYGLKIYMGSHFGEQGNMVECSIILS